MISLIFIIFFKINFVFAQVETKTYGKALIDNKTTEQLKNTTSESDNKKQQTSVLQNNNKNINTALKENNKNKKIKDQIITEIKHWKDKTKRAEESNNKNIKLKPQNTHSNYSVFQSAQKLLDYINSVQLFNIDLKESNNHKDKNQTLNVTKQEKGKTKEISNNVKSKDQIQKLFDYINSIPLFNIDLKDNSKNQKEKNQNINVKFLSIELESAFTVIKNELLEKNHNWKYFIPYIDTNIQYEISKNLFFEISFDLSYEENKWDYSLEEVFIQHHWSELLPTHLTLGYFEYPVFNLKESKHNFYKKTISEKTLFPSKYADIGVALKTNFWNSFYFQLSWQTQTGKRELLLPLNTAKNTWTASLGFEKSNQHIFANYFKQDSFLKAQKQAFGIGSHLSHSLYSLLFSFKGELWQINHWSQNTITYYVFPSIKWRRLALSFLYGKAHYQLGRQTSESLEYILKADFYLTDEFYLSLERLKESDTIVKNSAWAFSLKSHFNF